MKKFLTLILSFSLITAVFSGCTNNDEELRYEFNRNAILNNNNYIAVVSFNVAAPWGKLTDGTSSKKRVERFAAYMKAVNPSSIGTQEMNVQWIEKLKESMTGYDCYYVERGGDDSEKKSETNAIFWDSVMYRAIEVNTYWLSQTPAKESRYEEAGCNRIMSYVVLESLEGNRYIHINTHLDNTSSEAREFGAQVIAEKMREIQQKYGYPVTVLTGDFNDVIDSEPYKVFTEQGLTDSRFDANGKELAEPHSTYNDWGKLDDDGQPIDFIMSTASSEEYLLLDDLSNGYISDHIGVYSVYKIAD